MSLGLLMKPSVYVDMIKESNIASLQKIDIKEEIIPELFT